MASMFNILERLSNTSSRKDKENILRSLSSLDEPVFLDVAKYALDPMYDFYIKEFDMPEEHEHLGVYSLTETFPLLECLSQRAYTGNEARDQLHEALKSLSKEDAEVLKRIVKRDLRCGVSGKTINKVWPDHIYIHPYMRASSFSQKNLANINYPCISQTKMDGLYCDIIVQDETLAIMTRNGSELEIGGLWFDELVEACWDVVLQGELVALDEDGHIMERSLSNGYVNSDEVDPSRLRFYAWDAVPVEDFTKGKTDLDYEARFEILSQINGSLGGWFSVVDTRFCHSPDEVLEHFKIKRAEGEEGTIVKNKDMKWKNGTSKDQVKIKVIAESELLVTELNEGTGKYSGMLGAVVCKSSCGVVEVNVGTGFSDTQREFYWNSPDEIVGKVITVRYNDLVTNELKQDKYSLFLPRFIEVRTDKQEADDRNKIEEDVRTQTDVIMLTE